jgi:hypothetical protein
MRSQISRQHRSVRASTDTPKDRLSQATRPSDPSPSRPSSRQEPADFMTARPPLTAEQNFWRTKSWGG